MPNASMPKSFVSYSRADRQFVDDLIPLLRKVYGNDSVWFDDDIPGGHDWWQLILSEIAHCEVFVYLLSNEALASPYCQAEFREALRLQKPILPVIVRPKTQITDNTPTDLRDILEKTQHVDLSRGFRDYQANAALYASINRLVEHTPPSPPQPLVLQPISEPPVPDRRPRRRLTEPWPFIIGAVITGVFTVIAVVIIQGSPQRGGIAPQALTTTLAPGVTQVVADTPTLTLATTSTPKATNAAPGYTLVIERSADAVAICVNRAVDLSTLRVEFVGQNEHYTLGDVFPNNAATETGACWCLQQTAPRFAVPPGCRDDNNDNVSIQPRVADWRNAAVRLSLGAQPVGECGAQPSSLVYTCDLTLDEG